MHISTTRGDAECNVEKGTEDANTPPQGEVHSAHTMTWSTRTEKEDFGYDFANLLLDVQGTAQGAETRELTTDTGHLTMLVDIAERQGIASTTNFTRA